MKRAKRREEEEEDGGAKIKANKVWNFGFLYGTNLGYEFYYGSYDFVWNSRKDYEFQT